MLIYNREQEMLRREKEQKELEWERELQTSMKMSDPTGHGEGVGENGGCPDTGKKMLQFG